MIRRYAEECAEKLGTRLAGAYFRVVALYLFGVYLLWRLGFEAIYQHPTPFYNLPRPLGINDKGLVWVAFLALLSLAYLLFWKRLSALCLIPDNPLRERAAFLLVVATVGFTIAFSSGLAATQGGLEILADAYGRQGYEYAGDVQRTASIKALFAQYTALHETLSMHAQAHPPGPIVLLRLLGNLAGHEPWPLSAATIVFGSLSVLPLYFWVRDMLGQRSALIACALYPLMPTIALYTATSADILFMPFTLFTLCAFWRALHRNSVLWGLLAGLGYTLMTLMSFGLASVGIFFALVGLWRLNSPDTRGNVLRTAAVMLLTVVALHWGIRLWSGYDIIASFWQSKAAFDTHQSYLAKYTPRAARWAWILINPSCWVFFAGIPISLLFIWRLRCFDEKNAPLWRVMLGTLFVLNLLYLGQGEGERSAMYVMPFILIPAAHALGEMLEGSRSNGPLFATMGVLLLQTCLIETCFYTYW